MKALYSARRVIAVAPIVSAFLLMSLTASTSHADDRGHDCDPNGMILLSRLQEDNADNLNMAGLFRANASGDHVAQLTPLKIDDLYIGGRWPPDGQDIVYEYTTYLASLVLSGKSRRPHPTLSRESRRRLGPAAHCRPWPEA